MKLHLGCGENYLEGYVNIDLPPDGQSVMKAKADIYQDIRTLVYPENSIDEIRSHHLLEHFTRQEALNLLLQWRKWLKPGGLLVVETPDFETAARAFPYASLRQKFKIARHIFGSQEADWAVHKDWWGQKKFRFVLSKLEFSIVKLKKKKDFTRRKKIRFVPGRVAVFVSRFFPVLAGLLGFDYLDNIIVWAKKSEASINEEQVKAGILSLSLLGEEKVILQAWMKS